MQQAADRLRAKMGWGWLGYFLAGLNMWSLEVISILSDQLMVLWID
jgi:hypothetical protein